jgi:transposase
MRISEHAQYALGRKGVGHKRDVHTQGGHTHTHTHTRHTHRHTYRERTHTARTQHTAHSTDERRSQEVSFVC